MIRTMLLAVALVNLLQLWDCGPSPSTAATNEPNQSGGTIHFSGVIATKGGLVHVAILNAPDRSGPFSLSNVASQSDGSFKTDYSYTYNPSSNRPGCQYASSNQGYSLNVSATDVSGGGVSFANVAVADCGW